MIVLFKKVDKMSYIISTTNQCFAILQNTNLVKKFVNLEHKILYLLSGTKSRYFLLDGIATICRN